MTTTTTKHRKTQPLLQQTARLPAASIKGGRAALPACQKVALWMLETCGLGCFGVFCFWFSPIEIVWLAHRLEPGDKARLALARKEGGTTWSQLLMSWTPATVATVEAPLLPCHQSTLLEAISFASFRNQRKWKETQGPIWRESKFKAGFKVFQA